MASNALPSVFATGNHASRPAASAVAKGGIYSCTTHALLYQTDGSSWTTWATLGTAASGSITSSGYTQSTARLLGRTTASTGAIEEITVGTGLSLSAGSLTATGGAGISSGTSNPGSPSNGDLFYRSDLDLFIRYRSSGTRWVCTCLHRVQFGATAVGTTTGQLARMPGPSASSFDWYLESWETSTHVITTNTGSHFYTLQLEYWDGGGGAVSIGSAISTASDSPDVYVGHSTSPATVITNARDELQISVNKTGTPGSLIFTGGTIVYRLVVT